MIKGIHKWLLSPLWKSIKAKPSAQLLPFLVLIILAEIATYLTCGRDSTITLGIVTSSVMLTLLGLCFAIYTFTQSSSIVLYDRIQRKVKGETINRIDNVFSELQQGLVFITCLAMITLIFEIVGSISLAFLKVWRITFWELQISTESISLFVRYFSGFATIYVLFDFLCCVFTINDMLKLARKRTPDNPDVEK